MEHAMVGRARKKKCGDKTKTDTDALDREAGQRVNRQSAKRETREGRGGTGGRRASNGGEGTDGKPKSKSKGRRAGEDEASNQFVVELPPRLALDLLTPTESLERPDARFSRKRCQKRAAHAREAHLRERRERGPRDVWRDESASGQKNPRATGDEATKTGLLSTTVSRFRIRLR